MLMMCTMREIEIYASECKNENKANKFSVQVVKQVNIMLGSPPSKNSPDILLQHHHGSLHSPASPREERTSKGSKRIDHPSDPKLAEPEKKNKCKQ